MTEPEKLLWPEGFIHAQAAEFEVMSKTGWKVFFSAVDQDYLCP